MFIFGGEFVVNGSLRFFCELEALKLFIYIKGPSWLYGSRFTTTCAISLYHHYSWNPAHGEVYSILHYVTKVGGFIRILRFPHTNKTDRQYIIEILLKVALHTKVQTPNTYIL